MERINTQKFLTYLKREKALAGNMQMHLKTEDCKSYVDGMGDAFQLIIDHITKQDAVHKEIFDEVDDSATALNKLVRYDKLEKEYVKMVEKYEDAEETVIGEFSGDFKKSFTYLKGEIEDCIQNVVNSENVLKLCDLVSKIEEEHLTDYE